MKISLLLALMLVLSACQQGELIGTSTPITQTTEATRTPTQSPSATATQVITATPLDPTPTIRAYEVCVPLEDETFDSLPLINQNPLDIPAFGQDSGHHGVDFSYYRRGERDSIMGIEIYAILTGRTVLTLDDDIPYGYTVLIETPLTDLPESLQTTLLAAYLPIPEDPGYRLNCPAVQAPDLTGEYSIYHLYAHMEVRPSFQRGDPVACGEQLGTVGNTGYSSNPHLHLETRLGPSGADITTMAHYENSNTVEQQANYCLWRMSGYYQLFDPFLLFDARD